MSRGREGRCPLPLRSHKILAIVFPIMAFVASGLEHSVANVYFIPYGPLLRTQPEVMAAAGLSVVKPSRLILSGFLGNLSLVTIGNPIGAGCSGLSTCVKHRGKKR